MHAHHQTAAVGTRAGAVPHVEHDVEPAPARDDVELADAVRAGDVDAYAELWGRHAGAGRAAARRLTATYDPDDLLQEAFARILHALQAGAGPTGPFRPYLYTTLRAVAELLVQVFVREVYGTNRKYIIRLVLAEGRRFPKVAEFYYREVVGRAMAAMRKLVRRAVERGELRDDTLVRFPQLIVAPALVAIVWDGLFDRFEKLDPEQLMRAHFDILFASERKP